MLICDSVWHAPWKPVDERIRTEYDPSCFLALSKPLTVGSRPLIFNVVCGNAPMNTIAVLCQGDDTSLTGVRVYLDAADAARCRAFLCVVLCQMLVLTWITHSYAQQNREALSAQLGC